METREIFYGGDIISMDESEPSPEAVLVENGIITEIGTKKEILKMKDDRTKLTNLNGKTLMPAFIDSHSHLTGFAMALSKANLLEAASFNDITEYLRQLIIRKPITKDTWVVGVNYNMKNLEEKMHPNKRLLDSVCPSNPCVIANRRAKEAIINSTAMRILGLTPETPDPEDGHIDRNPETKELTGLITGSAYDMISEYCTDLPEDELIRHIREAQNIYLANGITVVQEGKCRVKEWEILLRMEEKGMLLLDTYVYIEEKSRDYAKQQQKRDYKHVHLAGIKLVLDGLLQTRQAWLEEEYNTEPGNTGISAYTDDQIEEIIRDSDSSNFQVIAHANGDKAIEQLVSTCEKVYKKEDDKRPVCIHGHLATQNQLERMSKIGMICSFFNNHVYHWGDMHLKNIGNSRAGRLSPLRTALDANVVFNFHQDTPATLPDMILSIAAAVLRLTKSGKSLGPDQRISVYEALKAVTINGAKTYHMEDKLGSITQGKRADLIILNKNPLKIRPEEINSVRVLATIREGEWLYSRIQNQSSSCCLLV